MAHEKMSYNFMLFGKTGAGKSATGNTLLDRNCFKCSISFNSCTEPPDKESNEFGDYIFNVVDTPGVHDTNKSNEEIIKNLHEAMSLIPEGFNALIFVLKMGDRSTKELLDTIKAIKALFGDSTFREVCIIALTNGDDAEKYGLNNTNIQEWLKRKENVRPGSELETLLRKCDYRAVLFYNKQSDKREESVNQLLSYINPQAPRYTKLHFQECAAARDEYVTSLGYPAKRAKIQTQISLLKAVVEDILKYDKTNIEPALSKINHLKQTLETESNGTDSMDDLKMQVAYIESTLKKLPEDKQQRREALQNIDYKLAGMKAAGGVLCTFGVVSGSAAIITPFLTAARVVAVIPGVGMALALGCLAVCATVVGIYALSNASNNSKKDQ